MFPLFNPFSTFILAAVLKLNALWKIHFKKEEKERERGGKREEDQHSYEADPSLKTSLYRGVRQRNEATLGPAMVYIVNRCFCRQSSFFSFTFRPRFESRFNRYVRPMQSLFNLRRAILGFRKNIWPFGRSVAKESRLLQEDSSLVVSCCLQIYVMKGIVVEN